MSLTHKVLTSSSLLVGIKFFQRLVGLLSILILARLLTPEDFALVALVSIIIHFFDILSNAGSEQYIIQKDRIVEEDLNTAWTIDIILKTSLWLLLTLTASGLADFFDRAELESALYVSSFILIINAAKNPGLFLKKQNFDYKSIFWLSMVQRILTFIIVVLVAYYERSYWAIIVGDIISSIIFTLGSFLIDKHRPRISLIHLEQQWQFSGWLFLKGIIGYTRSQIDTLIVSKFFTPVQLGQYYMARDIAMLPSHNLIMPALEPLLAAFKYSRSAPLDLTRHLRFSLFIIACISLPISVFLWFFPEPVILVLLGDQWSEAAPLLGLLSLLLLYFSFVLVFEQCMIAMQMVKALFWYDLISLCFITTGLLLFATGPLSDLALSRGIMGIITMLGLFLYLSTKIRMDMRQILLSVGPVFVASIMAGYFTQLVAIESSSIILDAAFLFIIFAASFASLLLLLISFSSGPDHLRLKVIVKDRLDHLKFVMGSSGK